MENRKKLLVTGGSHSELPLIESAKKRGWYVITTGNNPEGLGHRLADEYIAGDFSDKEYIYQIAKKNKVEAIVSGCNDFAYLSAAYASEKLQLPGYDSYEVASIIHHKNAFRDMTRDIGIRTPMTYKCCNRQDVEKVCDMVQMPVVVKPVDLTGGKGVRICRNFEEVMWAFEQAVQCTREAFIIIEEYIQGSNHGVSVLLKNQKVVWSVFDDEQYYKNKYLVSGASMPSSITQRTMFQLINDIEKIAHKLCLVDGLFHTQFIVEQNGMPVIIDPCRRAPGDLYILLAKYTTDVDYPEEIVKAYTGEELKDSYECSHKIIARECIMTDSEGVVDSIDISPEINEHIIDKLIWGEKGDVIEDSLKYKAGILIMQFPSTERMDKILGELYSKHIVIKKHKM